MVWKGSGSGDFCERTFRFMAPIGVPAGQVMGAGASGWSAGEAAGVAGLSGGLDRAGWG